MRHATLRWGPADFPLRRDFERELARTLPETAPADPDSILGGCLLLWSASPCLCSRSSSPLSFCFTAFIRRGERVRAFRWPAAERAAGSPRPARRSGSPGKFQAALLARGSAGRVSGRGRFSDGGTTGRGGGSTGPSAGGGIGGGRFSGGTTRTVHVLVGLEQPAVCQAELYDHAHLVVRRPHLPGKDEDVPGAQQAAVPGPRSSSRRSARWKEILSRRWE